MRVPEAEAFVVLRSDHEIPHSCVRRGGGPEAWVIEIGIEVAEIGFVSGVTHSLAALDPLVAGGQRVKAPVDEHAEAVVHEPMGVAVRGRRGGVIFCRNTRRRGYRYTR